MAEEEPVNRCDYCRLPIPKASKTLERAGEEYEYCSTACLEAVEESDRVFTEYHGHRRFRPGPAALDTSLPEGIPRNAFVLLTDLAGTRTDAVQAELVWRALQRGEPAVVVTFLEPPVSLIQTFASLEWNILPYLESGQLHLVDCFTYRVSDRERMFDRMNVWNRHLSSVAEGACTRVRDPGEVTEIESRLDTALEDLGMVDTGIVVIDSLTEFGSLVQPIQAYDFIKDVRAEVPKGRFVPVFAGATVAGENDAFPHDLDYMVDGIVDLRLNQKIVENALLKQIRVRKMSGVLIYPEWEVYEYTAGEGMVTFDPVAEMERSRSKSVEVVRKGETVLGESAGNADVPDGGEQSSGPDGRGDEPAS